MILLCLIRSCEVSKSILLIVGIVIQVCLIIWKLNGVMICFTKLENFGSYASIIAYASATFLGLRFILAIFIYLFFFYYNIDINKNCEAEPYALNLYSLFYTLKITDTIFLQKWHYKSFICFSSHTLLSQNGELG